jgi:hypothetical protein
MTKKLEQKLEGTYETKIRFMLVGLDRKLFLSLLFHVCFVLLCCGFCYIVKCNSLKKSLRVMSNREIWGQG